MNIRTNTAMSGRISAPTATRSSTQMNAVSAAAHGPAAAQPEVPPSLISLVATVAGRASVVRLDPEHRTTSHVIASLERLAGWLEDEDFTVTTESTTEGTVLHASKDPGVLYRNLSLVERGTRGTLVCWFEAACPDRLRVWFRPDWLALLVDAALIGLGVAITVHPWSMGSLSGDAAIAFVLLVVALPTQMPLLRARFLVMLTRAVWSTDKAWAKTRRHGRWWRGSWNVVGLAVVARLLFTRVIPYLMAMKSVILAFAPQMFQLRPVFTVGLVAIVLLVVAGGIGMIVYLIGSDGETNQRQRRD